VMKLYKLKAKQFLPISKYQAWEFFSSPRNLALITPERLNFQILSMSGNGDLYEGQIIRYRITVLPFIRMLWETEITQVVPLNSFTDVQRKGPYAYWSHKHIFVEVEGGVEMTDELEYAIPLGLLGRVVNFLFVGREVKSIFNYRFHVLKEQFSTAA
jgi:ligand-binding SRPBCC domain-containing protein